MKSLAFQDSDHCSIIYNIGRIKGVRWRGFTTEQLAREGTLAHFLDSNSEIISLMLVYNAC